MTTAKFSFKNSKAMQMYVGAMRRSAPMGIFYAVLLFLLFPLMYLLAIANISESMGQPAHNLLNGYAGIYNELSMVAMLLLCGVVPIVLGVMIFSFMHNRRAADVYHALPIKRQSLFSANYFAGLTLLWAPLILSFLLVLLTGGVFISKTRELYAPLRILGDLAGWLVVTAVIYTITAAVAVLAGNSFDTVLFSLAFCGMYPVLLILVQMTTEALLLGFSGKWGGLMELGTMASFSPFSLMLRRLAEMPANNLWRVQASDMDGAGAVLWAGSGINPEVVLNAWAIAVWGALAVVLFFVAMHLYTRRKSELAGRATTSRALNLPAKYALVFAAGCFGGALLYSMFNDKRMYPVGVLIGGAIAFAVLEAVVARGFKTFPKAFAQMGISVGLTCAFAVVLLAGGLGFAARVPAAETVQSVALNYNGRYGRRELTEAVGHKFSPEEAEQMMTQLGSVVLSSPEAIDLVRALHAATVAEQSGGLKPNYDDPAWQNTVNVRVAYQLKNGKTLERNYAPSSPETSRLVSRLEDMEEFERQTNPAFLLEAGQLESVTLSNRLDNNARVVPLDDAAQKKLFAALRRDVLEEKVADVVSGRYNAVGYLRLEPNYSHIEKPVLLPQVEKILITQQYESTLAFLRENDLLESMTLDESKITRAAIGLREEPWLNRFFGDAVEYKVAGRGGRRESGKEIVNNQVVFNPEQSRAAEWMEETDLQNVARLWKAARNSVSSGTAGYVVYFQYSGEQKSEMLFVAKDQLPEELSRRYDAARSQDEGNDNYFYV